MKRADELVNFKSQINLVEYAETLGYEVDKKESSKASVVMRGPGDDKIIVATAEDGHGVYFSVRNDADHGSIIDLAQSRLGINLGEVRKELRPWISGAVPTRQGRPILRQPVEKRAAKPVPSNVDRRQVLAAFSKMQPAGAHPYLVDERKLSPKILLDERFARSIRTDSFHKNAVFPHYDEHGLSGYELKNHGFTGFSKHGEKSVWYSANAGSCKRLVIVESAIDGLSHAQLVGRPDDGYLSLGGQPSPEQMALLERALAKAQARGAGLVLATDNDPAGEKLAAKIRSLAPEGMAIKRDRSEANDWNQDLKDSFGGATIQPK